MYIDQRQLKEFIADSGLVSPADLEAAMQEATASESDIGEMLIKQGKLTEDDYRRMLAYILGVPFVDLKGLKIEYSVLSLIPEPIARTHNIIAYKKNEDSLEVAMLDTADLTAIDFIKKKVRLKILPRLTSVESIKSALLQYQKSLKAEFGDIIQKESLTLLGGSEKDNLKSEYKQADDVPIIRVVDTLIKHAIIQNASDIHIEPLEKELIVRYRIDGILHDTMSLPKQSASGIIARIKVLANLKLDEKRLPQDGRFKIELNGERISFRVSTLPTYFGEKVVMRILLETSGGFSLESIGLHGESLERIHKSMRQREGMILTTGPTGSGKTTTLYTILELLNTHDVNICTVEDPIEYQIARINQTQVKPEIGYTFANGLRTLLRQDPNIIMVGEIRDNETAGLAVNAALTGHLVLSTLHTSDSAGAIPRLLDMKVEPFLLVSTVKVIIGQRLVRKLANIKESYIPTNEELLALGKRVDLDKVLHYLKVENVVSANSAWGNIPLFKQKQSDEAPDGFKGRLGIYEVLYVSNAIKDLIIAGKTSAEIGLQAKKEGMMTILEDGVFKAVQGLTTIEEIFRVVSEG